MSAAETDLVKLAAVKSWIGMKPEVVEFDSLLARLISGCSLFMQRYMERTIGAANYSHSADGPGATFMLLRHFPVTHVSSITVDGMVVPASNISHDGNRTVYLDGHYAFRRGRNNVALRYTAGYDIVPLDLAQACIDTVALRWRERDRIGQSSKGLTGETTTFTLVDFPKQVVTLMDTYKNRVPA